MIRLENAALTTACAALALTLGGCVFIAPSLEPIRYDMVEATPTADLDSVVKVRLGRLSLGLAKSIARAAADEEDKEVLDLLRHLKGVEVAVYDIQSASAGSVALWAERLEAVGDRRGWRLAARFQDDEEVGSVFYQERGGAIRSIYTFVVSDENLVLARFKGNLNEVIADAIALHSRELSEAVVDESL